MYVYDNKVKQARLHLYLTSLLNILMLLKATCHLHITFHTNTFFFSVRKRNLRPQFSSYKIVVRGVLKAETVNVNKNT